MLSGKWKYKENYGYGEAVGELYLEQEGNRLSGRIVFTDKVEDGDQYMIQEFLTGRVSGDGKKVWLEATDYDIIHSETPVHYELDHWFGAVMDDGSIRGRSRDEQGIEGEFIFEKI